MTEMTKNVRHEPPADKTAVVFWICVAVFVVVFWTAVGYFVYSAVAEPAPDPYGMVCTQSTGPHGANYGTSSARCYSARNG